MGIDQSGRAGFPRVEINNKLLDSGDSLTIKLSTAA
jgi:hypothetical protein